MFTLTGHLHRVYLYLFDLCSIQMQTFLYMNLSRENIMLINLGKKLNVGRTKINLKKKSSWTRVRTGCIVLLLPIFFE